MSRSGLRFLAVLLSALIVVVLFAGLDNLPRNVRAQVDAERTALASAQKQVAAAADQVNRDVRANPDLFQNIAASQQWPAQLSQSEAQLTTAAGTMAELTRLEKQNRRQDRQRVEALLATERSARGTAVAQATTIQHDADRWVDFKQHLPGELQQMSADYQAVHNFNLAPVTAVVQKAETDWPAKKPDLDARLASLNGVISTADSNWQASTEARREAAAGDFAHLNFIQLSTAKSSLDSAAAQLPRQAADLQALTGQLYYSWDKILVDMEQRGHGGNRSWDQKIRTIKTQVPSAAAAAGTTTSEEQWVDVTKAKYDAMRNDLGMAIAHKPAGEYDSQSDSVPQPAGFAYMAPPGQSNQYGHWEHRDGRDFWVFYGQYALMRDLLFNHYYRPIDRYDWDGYRSSRQSGHTYYGRDEGVAGAPKYGTQGSTTQDRYAGSSYARSGGFRDSEYARKSGSYRNSPFASGSQRGPEAERGAKRFGKFSGEEPHLPSRGFRRAPMPSPRPSFRMPSMPRRFGRR
jgi:hypothetical protein